MPKDLDQVASGAPERIKIPRMRIAAQGAKPERRRHDLLLLLDAPASASLGTRQHLATRHRTVSCTGANTGVCTTGRLRQVASAPGRRPSADGYDCLGSSIF